jgi:hypothetical protein
MNSNPYAGPIASTSWFEQKFLVRVIFVTFLSYLAPPVVWIVALAAGDAASDMPLRISYSSFWQYVFASKLPALFLIGSLLAMGSLSFFAGRHWATSSAIDAE